MPQMAQLRCFIIKLICQCVSPIIARLGLAVFVFPIVLGQVWGDSRVKFEYYRSYALTKVVPCASRKIGI